MAEESTGKESHAERVGRSGVRKSSLRLPRDSTKDWPANLGELLEWYGHEVTDVNRAAQLRIQEATELVTACLNSEITLEEAGNRAVAVHTRWSDAFPGGIEQVRGMTDEEIYKAMEKKTAKLKPDSGPSR
jgi:hypothetical protein